jgi:hypothetical protein
MMQSTHSTFRAEPTVSPLILCDRLLTLAKDADRAGMRGAAEHLLDLASEVLQPIPVGRNGSRWQ